MPLLFFLKIERKKRKKKIKGGEEVKEASNDPQTDRTFHSVKPWTAPPVCLEFLFDVDPPSSNGPSPISTQSRVVTVVALSWLR